MIKAVIFSIFIAIASSMSRDGKFVSFVGDQHVYGDPSQYLIKVFYDFDFGYTLTFTQDHIYEDANGVPTLINNLAQLELWQEANIGFSVNLYGF